LDAVKAFFAKRDTALKLATEKEGEEARKANARASKLTRAIGETLNETRTHALHVAAATDNAELFAFLSEKVWRG
jgi:hypothetical protein